MHAVFLYTTDVVPVSLQFILVMLFLYVVPICCSYVPPTCTPTHMHSTPLSKTQLKARSPAVTRSWSALYDIVVYDVDTPLPNEEEEDTSPVVKPAATTPTIASTPGGQATPTVNDDEDEEGTTFLGITIVREETPPPPPTPVVEEPIVTLERLPDTPTPTSSAYPAYNEAPPPSPSVAFPRREERILKDSAMLGIEIVRDAPSDDEEETQEVYEPTVQQQAIVEEQVMLPEEPTVTMTRLSDDEPLGSQEGSVLLSATTLGGGFEIVREPSSTSTSTSTGAGGGMMLVGDGFEMPMSTNKAQQEARSLAESYGVGLAAPEPARMLVNHLSTLCTHIIYTYSHSLSYTFLIIHTTHRHVPVRGH